MNFKKLWKIGFSTLMLLGLSACDVESEEERNVREQNERVYVQGLEDTVLSLVETITSDGRDQDNVAALEEEILATFPGRTDGEPAASTEMADMNERQAQLEAMMISIRTDLDTLLEMYEEALNECESCEDNTPVAALEEQVRNAVVEAPAAEALEDVLATEVVDEAVVAEDVAVADGAVDADEAVVADGAVDVDEAVVADGAVDVDEAVVADGAVDVDEAVVADDAVVADPETSALPALLSTEEVEISASLGELRRRETELDQEKIELFDALDRSDAGYSLDFVSDRVLAIDSEVADIMDQRDDLTLRLAELRLARIEASE